MIDLKALRQDSDYFRSSLARRGESHASQVAEILKLDVEYRKLVAEVEGLRAQQNRANDAIASAKREGADASQAIAEMKSVAAQSKKLGEEVKIMSEQLDAKLAAVPNLPDPTAAEPEDQVLRVVGDTTLRGRDHLELAGQCIDMESAAKLSGSRFVYLKGELVFLELALVRWVLEKLSGKGFQPVIPPVLVREQALFGTGFLPDTEQQIYRLADDGLYLVGTSEVALASLHADQILSADELPLRYAGFSPCFRREAGAAGRDTRGIFRVHQFDKVEMFTFVEPSQSQAEHERILAIEEEILQDLEIPYRVVNIAVSDLGASAAKKYDCEAWLPGQGQYRELTSCSNTTDYQARRLAIRYRNEKKKAETLHTLNGTAVAVGRTMIALLENGQQDDGSVVVPNCLVEHGAPRTICRT